MSWSQSIRTLSRILWRSEDQSVYLTFDDGPDANMTPKFLDLLDELDIQVTFFVVGKKAEEAGDLLRRIYRSGHTIGNHSYGHSNLLGKPKEFIFDELTKTDQVIKTITGRSPSYFRPPFGRFGMNVLRVLDHTEHQLVLWSSSCRDYKRRVSVLQIEKRLRLAARPGQLVLLHDGHRESKTTLRALQRTLTSLKRDGIVFSALPQNGFRTWP